MRHGFKLVPKWIHRNLCGNFLLYKIYCQGNFPSKGKGLSTVNSDSVKQFKNWLDRVSSIRSDDYCIICISVILEKFCVSIEIRIRKITTIATYIYIACALGAFLTEFLFGYRHFPFFLSSMWAVLELKH